DALVIRRDGDDLGAAAAFLERDALDAFGAHFLQELGISDLGATGAGAVELLEHGEKHQCDNQPDCNLREPLIVHRGSFIHSRPTRLMLCASPHRKGLSKTAPSPSERQASTRSSRYMGTILDDTRVALLGVIPSEAPDFCLSIALTTQFI